jgi:DNA-binding MltR family transcriptional regulator
MGNKKKKPHFTMWELFHDRFKAAEAFERESDRAVALITAEYLNLGLELLLRKCLIAKTKVVDEFFGFDRPLGTFSARIKMGYCLGHMSDHSFKDLNTIRDIRNDFAHSRETISFSTQSINDRCLSLRIPMITAGWVQPDFSSSRIRYIEATSWIGNQLQARESEIVRPSWPNNRA